MHDTQRRGRQAGFFVSFFGVWPLLTIKLTPARVLVLV